MMGKACPALLMMAYSNAIKKSQRDKKEEEEDKKGIIEALFFC